MHTSSGARHKLIIRPHAAAPFFVAGKGVGGLGVGAITYIEQAYRLSLVGMSHIDFNDSVYSKVLEKGRECESAALDLLSDYRFERLTRNPDRLEMTIGTVGDVDVILSGMPDIILANRDTIDIKCPWSIMTMPITRAGADDAAYFAQGQAYMLLTGGAQHTVSYVLIDTPGHLIKYDDERLHRFDSMPIDRRVFEITYQRDESALEKFTARLLAAGEYFSSLQNSA